MEEPRRTPASSTRRTRRARSWARRIGRALLAGLIATFALIVLLVWLEPLRSGQRRYINLRIPDAPATASGSWFGAAGPGLSRWWWVSGIDRPGSCRLFWMLQREGDLPWYPYNLFGPADADGTNLWPLRWPRFGMFGHRPEVGWGLEGEAIPARGSSGMGFEIAHGFPFLAVSCRAAFDRSIERRSYVMQGGLMLAPDLPGSTGTFRVLPWRPVWSGLLLDIAIFALLWLGVTEGCAVGVRFLRLRRNRCPACGYSLAGQASPGCPECGWARAPRAANP